jgi:2'-5' RNA ligase
MSNQFSFAAFESDPTPTDRLFFAIFPDTDAAMRIALAAQGLCREHGLTGKPLETGRFHITLHHLGDYAGGLSESLVAQGREAGAALGTAPFEITFDRATSFAGKPGKLPLVLRGGNGLDALTAFQHSLGTAMAKTGLARRVETNFTPHVTLSYGDRRIVEQPIEPISWTVREFVLVHSLLGKTRHIPLGRWPLQG